MPRRPTSSSKGKGISDPYSGSNEVATACDLEVATEVVTKQASDHYIDVRGWHNEIRHAIGINDPYGEVLPEDNTILKELHRLRADKTILRAEYKAGLQELLNTVMALSAELRGLRAENVVLRAENADVKAGLQELINAMRALSAEVKELRKRGMGRPPQMTAQRPMPPSTPPPTLVPVGSKRKRGPMSPPPPPRPCKSKGKRMRRNPGGRPLGTSEGHAAFPWIGE
jgi:hypothetical protein